jgi:N-hydroxyarylamine O-acetyltransferase
MTDLDAYFARIGYSGPRAPTLAVLRELHRLHPAAIPFEAIDCLLDRGIDISPAAVDAKLIHGGRGGYCFEQNGLFRRVLEALGFETVGLAARVRWNAAPGAPAQPRTHMILRVKAEGRDWLADVGFGGCVLTAPLAWEPEAVQATDHDSYRLTPIGGELRLEVARDAGWVPAYDLSPVPCVPRDYEMANWFTSTHPSSHFRANLMVSLTTAQARYGLLQNRLTVRPLGGEPTRELLDADGMERVLAEVFRLPVEPAWRPVLERIAAAAAS